VGLVGHGHGHLAQLLAVLAGVVGTEEKLESGGKRHPKVGLGSATVATVGRRQGGGARGNCSGPFGLSLIFVSSWLTSHRGD
jgi:hypothetical protein